mgnify:CR=1 FL=1
MKCRFLMFLKTLLTAPAVRGAVSALIRGLMALLLITSVPASQARSEEERTSRKDVIHVRSDHDYAPFEFLDNGIPAGFNIDLLRETARVMGFKIEIVLGPWDTVRRELEEGKIDMLAGMFYSRERDRKVDFSLPHTVVTHDLFVREGSPLRSLEDLAGKRLMVQKGDIMHDYALEKKLSTNLVALENVHDIIQGLSEGKADAALLQRYQVLYYTDRMGINNLKGLELKLMPQKYCFAVREGNRVLLARLNEGLGILKMTGKYREIHEKWFGIYDEEETYRVLMRYALWVLAPLLALLILTLGWSWTLRRRVALRTAELMEELERRQRAERGIIELSYFRERIIDNANVWINALDREMKVSLWNEAAERISGYRREEVLGGTEIWNWLYPDEAYREEIVAKAREILEGDSVVNLETRIRSRDGSEKIISWNSDYLLGEDGEMIGSIAVGLDVTENRRMESEIRQSLEEKNVLLKEVHHRVKNNMQVISSILSLQERHLNDPRDVELFRECRQRIRSMALVHEQLYRSENFSGIEMKAFLSALAREITQASPRQASGLALKLEISEMWLGIDAAIPCSLIVNELLSNALKHAFAETEHPELLVSLSQEEGEASLVIRDNGRGLPEDFETSPRETLGWRLVQALTRQIGGKVEVASNGGACFIVRFPVV